MASFPTSPQPLKMQVNGVVFKVLISESESGYEQRRQIWPNPKHSFKVSYDVLTQNEMQTLWDFYVNTASGTLNTFDFTDHVSGSTYSVRFNEPSLSMEEFQYRLFRTGLELIEVF